jgi:choline dehydrogenase-like flavoprotein
MADSFDYVIVGRGAAGPVLASPRDSSRLAGVDRGSGGTVCVLEWGRRNAIPTPTSRAIAAGDWGWSIHQGKLQRGDDLVPASAFIAESR